MFSGSRIEMKKEVKARLVVKDVVGYKDQLRVD